MISRQSEANAVPSQNQATPANSADLTQATFGSKCSAVLLQPPQTPEQRYAAITLPPDSVYQRTGNVESNSIVLDTFQRTYGAVPDDVRRTRYLPTFAVALSHSDATVRAQAIAALTDVGTNHGATVPTGMREAIRWKLNQLANDTNQPQSLRTAATSAHNALAAPRD